MPRTKMTDEERKQSRKERNRAYYQGKIINNRFNDENDEPITRFVHNRPPLVKMIVAGIKDVWAPNEDDMDDERDDGNRVYNYRSKVRKTNYSKVKLPKGALWENMEKGIVNHNGFKYVYTTVPQYKQQLSKLYDEHMKDTRNKLMERLTKLAMELQKKYPDVRIFYGADKKHYVRGKQVITGNHLINITTIGPRGRKRGGRMGEVGEIIRNTYDWQQDEEATRKVAESNLTGFIQEVKRDIVRAIENPAPARAVASSSRDLFDRITDIYNSPGGRNKVIQATEQYYEDNDVGPNPYDGNPAPMALIANKRGGLSDRFVRKVKKDFPDRYLREILSYLE